MPTTLRDTLWNYGEPLPSAPIRVQDDALPPLHSSRRHDPLPSEPDPDELPSYDSTRAPAYTPEEAIAPGRELDGSSLVFSLRQLSRKAQAFISMGPPMNVMRGPNQFTEIDSSLTPGHLDDALPYSWQSTARRYNIDHKSGSRFSSQKPDFVISVVDPVRKEISVPPTPPILAPAAAPAPTKARKSSFFGRTPKAEVSLADAVTARLGSISKTSSNSNSESLADAVEARLGSISKTNSEPLAGAVEARRGSSNRAGASTLADEPRRSSRTNSNPSDETQRSLPIAEARFARSGPLPWTPRAQIVYDKEFIGVFGHDGHALNEGRQQDMKLARPIWKTPMFGKEYGWVMATGPTRLAFVDLETEIVKANFIYSEQGSWAPKDGEVGRLHVPLQALPSRDQEETGRGRVGLQDGFMEFLVCSLSVAIAHWRNEGKMLHNVPSSRQRRDEMDDQGIGSEL